ncbi:MULTISPECIES: metallophosphoesterase family protein [Paenibacillus]|uniref:metallophosphoesterase family protein n=1 Tax=Paenibacillus TaxID=44249 RepID=UPI0022B85DCC|nr:metallophosphoesterase family protein [Paenibacillus caseinilyticus]MCZ8519606.1 metallophosphoesterase family protein [Paenibacillus caseinilyticus]
MFSGDVIHSEECKDPLDSYKNAVRAVEEAQVPWAAIFGNHDAEHERGSKEDLIRLQQQFPHCLTEAGPALDNRLGNYTTRIQSRAGRNDELPAAALYLFDSGSHLHHPVGGYERITHSQIGWYQEQAGELRRQNNGEPVFALSFLHIPLPEYNEVWNYHTCYGHNYEGMGCPKVNSGLFSAFLEMEDVKGVFAGHDHVNDFWGELHGIRLHYGRATGYNSYGREGYPRGARMIRLTEGAASFHTWIRLDDGTMISRQPEHPPEQIRKRI